jgi:hypothetical protein
MSSILQTYLEQTKTKFNKGYKGMNLAKVTTTVGLNSKLCTNHTVIYHLASVPLQSEKSAYGFTSLFTPQSHEKCTLAEYSMSAFYLASHSLMNTCYSTLRFASEWLQLYLVPSTWTGCLQCWNNITSFTLSSGKLSRLCLPIRGSKSLEDTIQHFFPARFSNNVYSVFIFLSTR